MKAISKRLCRLESRLGLGPGTEQLLLVVTAAGRELALDQDRCIQILRECGFLPTGPVGLVNLVRFRMAWMRRNWRGICGNMARRLAGSAVLKIMVNRQAGLRKRTRGDEDDRQTSAHAGGEIWASARDRVRPAAARADRGGAVATRRSQGAR
jgi:hypothetical protein